MSIQIEMRYKLRGSEQIHVRVIPTEQYFDPPGPGKTYSEHGDPKHAWNHEYLEVDVAELEWTECIRRGAMGNATLRMEYLRDGWLSHAASTADEPELLLFESRLPDGSEHTVRLRRLSQTHPWKVESNFFWVTNAEGVEEGIDLETEDLRRYPA